VISHYLEKAISNIEDLIELTKADIEDIKNARNDEIYQRTKIKDEIIMLFENQKQLLDSELLRVMKQNKDKELSDILSEDEKKLLEKLKIRLKELQTINKDYAKLVVAVNEFYASLFEKIFPTEMENYKKINPKSFSLLKVTA
jgi:phosphoribosylformylglycinamidine (FGAM) synthase-like enzyme